MSDIPQWVVSYCRHWGSQKRRIWSGTEWYLDADGKRRYDVDGYAESLMGRIREERDGAGQGETKQHWPEVYWGRGLEVQREIFGMPEVPLACLHLHYVWDPIWGVTAAKKAALIHISLRAYWSELKKGEFWLFARLDRAHDQVCDIKPEIEQTPLQVVGKTPTFRRTSAKVAKLPPPEINLRALNREILTLFQADPEKPAA